MGSMDERVAEDNEDRYKKSEAATDETDFANMGTYNYCGEYVIDGPRSVAGAKHLLLDITPYFAWGNVKSTETKFTLPPNGWRYENSEDAIKAREAFLKEWNEGIN